MPEALYAPLLPCPFCGHEEPTFERVGTPRQSCIVICGNCGCRHESSDEGARSGTQWNTRADATCSLRSAPKPELQEAFAERYKSDPADPSCAEMLSLYSDGWADCSLRGGQQGWISVEERLPADEETVFCTGFIGNDPANARWAEVASHQGGSFYDTETGDDFYPPTHWKPLDLPPPSTHPQETQP